MSLKNGLLIQALTKVTLGMVIVGGVLFLSAGSFGYWQGWLLMGALFVPMVIAGFVLLFNAPDLLKKRLNAKEKQSEQRGVVAASGVLFIAAFVVSGLAWRYGWYILPDWVIWVATALFGGSYAMYGEVLRENRYLSRTIEVQEGQKVVDTGLYGIVRHPMYTATTALFLAMPLMLGSPIAAAIMLLYIPLIVKRIINEEQLLEKELEGYSEYKQRVRYRLLPFIW